MGSYMREVKPQSSEYATYLDLVGVQGRGKKPSVKKERVGVMAAAVESVLARFSIQDI